MRWLVVVGLIVGQLVGIAPSARGDQADPVIPAELQPALAELFTFQEPNPLAGLESLDVAIGPRRVRYWLRLPGRDRFQVEVVLRSSCPDGAEPRGGGFCLVAAGPPELTGEVRQALVRRLTERSPQLAAGLAQIPSPSPEPAPGPEMLIPVLDLSGLVLLLGLVGWLLGRRPSARVQQDRASASRAPPIPRLVAWACLAVLGGLHATAWTLWGDGPGSVGGAASLWWQQLAALAGAAGLEPVLLATGLGVMAHGGLVWISCWAAWRVAATDGRGCPGSCDLGAGLVLASSPWLAVASAAHAPEFLAGIGVVASTVWLIQPTAHGGRGHGLFLIAGLAFSPWVALVLIAHSLLALAPWTGVVRRERQTWIRFGLLWVAAGLLLGRGLLHAISSHGGPPWFAGTVGLHPNLLACLWGAGLGWALLGVVPWSLRPATWAGAGRPWTVVWLVGLSGLSALAALTGGAQTVWMTGVSGVTVGLSCGALARRSWVLGWIGLGLISAANLISWTLNSF